MRTNETYRDDPQPAVPTHAGLICRADDCVGQAIGPDGYCHNHGGEPLHQQFSATQDTLVNQFNNRHERKESNPKDAAGSSRLPLHLVPDTLNIFAAMAMAEGDSKYIGYNFRVAGVRVMVYVAALRRHLMRYVNGEWADKKTGVPHLGSVAACTAILIDGHVVGNIVDDRPPGVDLGDSIEEAERIIRHVYEMNKNIRPQGVEYTAINTDTQLPTATPHKKSAT